MRDVAHSRRTIGTSTDRAIRVWCTTQLVDSLLALVDP
jgi:hypothetical protein